MNDSPKKLDLLRQVVLALVLLLGSHSHLRADLSGHAVLVGCTQYAHLDTSLWLKGSENDVALMHEQLTGQGFGMPPENVTVLAGWPDDPDRRPTRANIERAFSHLREKAGEGDQVVILMAGHGSQQPADEDPKDPELDGLDEIFLPADVGRWNGETGVVENAITDDEIRDWLNRIRNTGAFVWMVFDACHSGTMTRGAPPETSSERRLPTDVLVPREALMDATRRAAKQSIESPSNASRARTVVGLSDHAGEMVAMYAAQSTELAPEFRVPDKNGPYHGLFTYTLSEVLAQSQSALTYRELVDRVNTRYRAMGRTHPTPLLEGGGLDREVLGLKEWPDRPTIQLTKEVASGEFELLAGTLRGITKGSVLSVYPPAGEVGADRVAGHVKVTRVKPLTSVVVPTAHDDLPAPEPERLKPGSRCAITFIDFGDQQLRVALQTGNSDGQNVATHPPGEGPGPLEAAFASLERQTAAMVERTGSAVNADWFIRVVNDRALLVPAAGWASTPQADTVPDEPPAEFTLGDLSGEDLNENLNSSLQRIARARQLLKLTKQAGTGRRGKRAVAIEVQLVRYAGGSDPTGEVVAHGNRGRILHPGDKIGFRITNPSQQIVDVTLLFVDSGYGITAVFPDPGTLDDNRIKPGESVDSARFEVDGETWGHEQIVTIATKATRRRVDFTALEQPTLERAAGFRGEGSDSPLAQLLDSAMYGKGATRGIGHWALNNHAVKLLCWYTARK